MTSSFAIQKKDLCCLTQQLGRVIFVWYFAWNIARVKHIFETVPSYMYGSSVFGNPEILQIWKNY